MYSICVGFLTKTALASPITVVLKMRSVDFWGPGRLSPFHCCTDDVKIEVDKMLVSGHYISSHAPSEN